MIAIRTNLTYAGRSDAPTPQEIRRACKEIQATWSPRERARRYRSPYGVGWTPPLIRLWELVEAIQEERSVGPG